MHSFQSAFETVEIYSLSGDSWRYGPLLPDAVTDATIVSIVDKEDGSGSNRLVFVGGYSDVNG